MMITEMATTSDMLAIYKHVLGTKKLEKPEQLLAADVNRDGKITLADITLVKKLINGVIDKFPNVDSWIFIPGSHVFTDPNNPFGVKLFYKFTIISTPFIEDFIGIKMGDVNCSADPKTE